MSATIEKYLTPSQAARALGISAVRVRQLENAGQLPAIRTSFGRLFDPDVVEQARRERETRAAHKETLSR